MDNELVSLLKALIKIDTTNPPGNEIETEKIIIPFLEQNNISYKIHRSCETRSNIIAEIGEKNSKTLLIACHTDVVPAGDGWDTDPFDPVIKDKRIYGRGAIDNKGPLVAVLTAMKNLKKKETDLNCRFVFAIVADEERGSTHGMGYLLENNLIHADYAIIPDTAGNMRYIVTGEKGTLRLQYTFIGKQAHGSIPKDGINAIHFASEFVQKIKNYTLHHEPNKDFTPPTINIGLIKGGSAINIVPGKCDVTLDIRFLPDQNSKTIKEELDNIAKTCGKFESYIEISINPILVEHDSKIVKIIQKATQKVNNITAKTMTIGGGTVSKDLVKHNIISVGFGCGNHDMFHVANESADIDELEQFSKVIEQIVLDF
ncbi:MAG: ArgE/DapE family deacylase [Candidatus Aenigmarchaeota archaeon]|nr:ArgE/DapE family deacylase [Candidatus Aenigmarchaeota archaeon]